MAQATRTELAGALRARHAGTMKLATHEALDTSHLRFDYEQVDEAHRGQVMQAAVQIKASADRMRDSIFAIGNRLLEVKDYLPHGQFGEWLRVEFDLSVRMAQNMMNVAREYGGKSETVSLLSDSVLYLLAAPSTPAEAREAVEQQVAVTGKPPTRTEVKRVIDKHRPAPEPSRAKVVYVEPEPKAEPQPVSAQVLDNMIWEWVTNHARETMYPPDEVLAFLDIGETTRSTKLRDQLIEWLREQGIDWNIGDLPVAVKRIRDQRPQPAPPPAPTPDDLHNAGYVIIRSPEGETYRWVNDDGEVGDWWPREDAIQDARQRIALSPTTPQPAPTPLEAARLLVATVPSDEAHAQTDPAPALDALVELMIDPRTDITTTLQGSLHWAVKQASDEQLQAAWRRMSDAVRASRGPVLVAALKKRGIVTEQPAQTAPVATTPADDDPDHEVGGASHHLITFDEWIDAMPSNLDRLRVEDHLRACLSILQLAKTTIQRVRQIEPDLANPAGNALPSLTILLERLGKKVRRAD